MDLLKELPRLLPMASEWAETESNRILAAGEPLGVDGVKLAKCVGVRLPSRVRLFFVYRIPRPSQRDLAQACKTIGIIGPGTRALTLGYGVYIRDHDKADSRLLAHELRHVSQYEDLGSIPAFLAKYVPELIQYGPASAPLELDASSAADRCP